MQVGYQQYDSLPWKAVADEKIGRVAFVPDSATEATGTLYVERHGDEHERANRYEGVPTALVEQMIAIDNFALVSDPRVAYEVEDD